MRASPKHGPNALENHRSRRSVPRGGFSGQIEGRAQRRRWTMSVQRSSWVPGESRPHRANELSWSGHARQNGIQHPPSRAASPSLSVVVPCRRRGIDRVSPSGDGLDQDAACAGLVKEVGVRQKCRMIGADIDVSYPREITVIIPEPTKNDQVFAISCVAVLAFTDEAALHRGGCTPQGSRHHVAKTCFHEGLLTLISRST